MAIVALRTSSNQALVRIALAFFFFVNPRGSNSLLVVPEKMELSVPVDPRKHFFLSKGITYLNVATLGPMPKCSFKASVNEWKTLESNPCELYDWGGSDNKNSRLDAVRAKAAAMLGIEDINEITFVQSTTYGLHLIAQGLVSSGYLSRGTKYSTRSRRVLTTVSCGKFLKTVSYSFQFTFIQHLFCV